MYELALMEWLVIAIIFTAGIYGCVVSSRREARAVSAAPTNAVRNQFKSEEVK